MSSSLEGIAIIGLACRLPGAKQSDDFWQNLCAGVESIAALSDQELLATGVDPQVIHSPRYVKSKAIIDDIDLFDASFFGYSPKEAAIIDPQQRLFLECAWEALERSGYMAEDYDGAIGVYAGAGMNSYLTHLMHASQSLMQTLDQYQVLLGNDKDFLTTRVSYKLNLTGPSVTIQTACSTSLVAVHLACQGLLNYQCDIALAGGVSVAIPQATGYWYHAGGILAPDGHCRAFDAKAEGTVPGSGLGIVVLKRLSEALTDGDHIYAVIKGSAINNDGGLKLGYTAPSVEGQSEVIAAAQALANVTAESITYIEAHGTGTALGDPIEIAALTRVFRDQTEAKGFCAIGSVKTNIGHLDTAAGVAGLIKTALALKHTLVPPSLHFEQANPAIDFANSPFYVNRALSPWPTGSTPRRAGVSSFGVGGTNAHVILEEAPLVEPTMPSRPWQVLMFSAKRADALEGMTANLLSHLMQHPETQLADAAYTLQVGRRSFGYRRTVLCRDVADAVAVLTTLDPDRIATGVPDSTYRRVVFMFPGQGAHHVGMASELYQHEPTFRRWIDRGAEFLMPLIRLDLKTLLYPAPEQAADAQQHLEQTAIAQPALFVIEYALAQLWIEWGVRPCAMIGHSVGEYVAACLAGVCSWEDALALLATRGRLMQALPRGTMLSIALSEQQLRPLLDDQLALAATNAPALCVVSGPAEAVATLQVLLVGQGVDCRPLRVSHAFHSAMMEPIREAFLDACKQVRLSAPELPFLSNVTGTWITAAEATDPAYWAAHMCQTVRFTEGIQTLLQAPDVLLLEVGPGQILHSCVRQHTTATGRSLASLRHPEDSRSEQAVLLAALAQLWRAGIPIDWSGFYSHERRRRIPLPTYPFDRQRCWLGEIDAQPAAPVGSAAPALSSARAAPDTPIEQTIGDIWQDLLGIRQIGIHDDFFELGGHSLLATRLITELRERFQAVIPLGILFEAPTIAKLAQRVAALIGEPQSALQETPPVVDWAVEATLDPTILPESPRVRSLSVADAVFLTGVSGFLGAFLIYELLQQTSAKISCLIRAASVEQGMVKIQRHLEAYGLWQEQWNSRILPIVGDLSQPLLGLSEQAFHSLADQIDLIYHAGAWVNFAYPYYMLKATNVLGTQEILRLASRGRLKPVHFISTTAVFPPSGSDHIVREDAMPELNTSLLTGYAQSKMIAEHLVAAARSRGIPASIYRPATVSAHSETGMYNSKDFTLSMMKSCIQMGSVPADLDTMAYMAPVDYVSKAIVSLSGSEACLNRNFHVIPPFPTNIQEMFEMVQALGYPVQQVPYSDWISELVSYTVHAEESAMRPFLHLLDGQPHVQHTRFDCSNTQAGLAGTTICCPAVDTKSLGRFFSQLVRDGFLDAPQPGNLSLDPA